jgi:hypothetical protein
MRIRSEALKSYLKGIRDVTSLDVLTSIWPSRIIVIVVSILCLLMFPSNVNVLPLPVPFVSLMAQEGKETRLQLEFTLKLFQSIVFCFSWEAISWLTRIRF